ncbi:cobyrinate a,c-diamide synthase [Geobacillus sp. FSL K6-0789]|uniref:Cobyrinate a,c-diamide synthase n=2 Tax=Geobacillus stearothermophilus TaxID=1422 RepID=A0A3L7DBK2_GEOSE|nr:MULTISPECIES: cobyrinate a,c-diamide synthase [Geobacillus]KMY58281.1 cobyrinic acid a,c-diamide synthase [Geobacillus stearothermophilus]KMY59863.1 cobyrinic acid a,c-diamide synthase [Geobacillus stearothermophilus]KMY62634.1 cobyrinic acid a,c-diamide synthase [Geobacillus stearothermophilus]MBR2516529.1 cobyrinate a,c-diamide synthase [Geobacillus sp.]MED3724037.1 cobyrinate a,c-diamide synthase [Geobacillus stearothermophilus]
MRRLVIAAPGSGAGKTTVTLGLMAAMRQQGYTVQGFKCGPDYIDPTYHTAVTGRPARNLDSWMMGSEAVKTVLANGCQGADIAIIEGVMGLFDGKQPLSDEGATAKIAVLTESPVLLVVDCSGMARSAAAIVHGFQTFRPDVRLAGVFANRVGSEGHFRLVKAAIEQTCGVPVVGFLTQDEALALPERHLGLVPSVERGELDSFFANLGRKVARTIDWETLLSIAEAPALCSPAPLIRPSRPYRVRVAVAKDAAFHFYYPENLEMLSACGAELVYFSPLAGEPLPDGVNGLYIGGGFPEEFAAELARQAAVKQSIRAAIEHGLPTLAECGGFMFLTEQLVATDGSAYEMAGVIPGKVVMKTKLAALGYREVRGRNGNFLLPEGETARGHEFHYSVYEPRGETPFAYETSGRKGTKPDGYLAHRLFAGYVHFHFASAPAMVERWLAECEKVTING